MPFRSISTELMNSDYVELESIIERNAVLQLAAGVVPRDWVEKRRLGSVKLDPELTFVDLAHEDAPQYIHRNLNHVAVECGVPRIDFGALLGPNRRFTQAIASHFYELLDPDTDQPLFDGISYYSSLNPTKWRCWAVFDQRYVPQNGAVTPVLLDDPELFQATRHLDLVIDSRRITDE